jgi:hypothetical protein
MKTQNGNALWFILIAVALLGLLTVAMTRGGGSSNETGSFEQNQIRANEMMGYASTIESAVQSLIARGCSENDISFWHDSDGNNTEDASDDYYNANSPTDHSCHVFDVAGAGITYISPTQSALRTSDTGKDAYGEHAFTTNNLPSFGTERNLMMITPYIKRDICVEINRTLNITNPAGEPPEDPNISVAVYFTGSFPAAAADSTIGDSGTSTILAGKKTGCVFENGGCNGADCYNFYHVLIAR